MPKKKYFLTQAELAKLLKNYGGGYRWTHDKKLSQSGNVTYTDAQNNMLTINQLWDKDTDKPYVMVHISDSTGRIYRKDKWDWFETIRQLHFDWTLQGGQYDLEFKSIEGDKMAKKKRQSYTQELKAQIESQKDIIAERDKEIERLQGIIADLQQNKPAIAPSEDMQRELDEAIRMRNWYKNHYKEECDKSQKLAEEVEHLKLQLAEEPTTDHISDDELDSDVKYGEPWYVAYESKSKSELAKRLHFVETISQRRQRQIKELKKQVNDKKYAQYVQEDALTYNEALARADRAETIAEQYLEYNKDAHKKNEELQRQLTELASASLTPEESMQIIEQNIEQSNELKKAARKKQGAPRRIDDRKVALMCELHKKGHSIREISKQVGCSVGSVHRLLNENKQ
ncbi:helix-turn-helix domain-containing protein [Blautia wexlerae]|uniref:helix-turn-helix domain-containing protein n=1 Tax=Blautia wexlerae TaxID=418240 RepID=UPI00325AC9E6